MTEPPHSTEPAIGPDSDHDAPRFRHGAGRLCLDYIRTLRYRGTDDPVDELARPTDLAAWVSQFGPCPADASGPAHTADALELRKAVFDLVQAARSPEGVGSCPRTARDVVNRVAATAVPTPVLDASVQLRWQADDPVAATLALIARDALDLVTSPAIGQVRACASPTCEALFCDTSRPGNRRWCSMGSCGNQAKKNTFRGKGKSDSVSVH